MAQTMTYRLAAVQVIKESETERGRGGEGRRHETAFCIMKLADAAQFAATETET